MGVLLNQKPAPDGLDPKTWLEKQSTQNGLGSIDLKPWHIVITYDQFDEDGDNVHSGIYEEYWVNPTKYRRIYQCDNLNQADYGTDKGLYRYGDQRWPDRAQLQVRTEIVEPFAYAATLEDVHARAVERRFGSYTLQCVLIERNQGVSDPTQFCFEPGTSVLRYSRGWGWFQTAYNGIVPFQDRNVARDVDVTNGGKAYLKLRVETLEQLPKVDDAQFNPPLGAVPVGDRISGVTPTAVDMKAAPRWPDSLRGQHFTVTFEAIIGKDGRVLSTRAISGPPEAYKACEDAIKKWRFKPYLVLGRPVELEAKLSCGHF